MKKIKHHKIILLISMPLLFLSCLENAERDNPLDPKSSHYESNGTITGIVYNYYPPYSPIADAQILAVPGHYWSTSNEAGQFSLQHIPANNYKIYVSCSGFADDSTQIILNKQTIEEIQFNLNGLPQLVSCSVKSGHISRWWPQDDLYLLFAQAEVTDFDGLSDITSVRFKIPQFNFIDSLNRTEDPAIFTATFYEQQLTLKNLHQVLGYPVSLIAEDRLGTACESSLIYIARFIDDTPILLAPRGSQVVNQQPVLEWQQFILEFPFTFKIEVIRVDEGIKTPVWTIESVSSDSVFIQVAESLPNGTYYWTLSAVDEFGNWSRSKEAAFEVIQN